MEAANEPSSDLPGSLDLGAFSISLAVADLAASQKFYERLGFEAVGGNAAENWLILKNGEATIGLFQSIIDRNTITFNPGLSNRMEQLEAFTDVRDIQRHLKAAGAKLSNEAEENSTGAAHILLVDPDGNPVLIDQFF